MMSLRKKIYICDFLLAMAYFALFCICFFNIGIMVITVPVIAVIIFLAGMAKDAYLEKQFEKELATGERKYSEEF